MSNRFYRILLQGGTHDGETFTRFMPDGWEQDARVFTIWTARFNQGTFCKEAGSYKLVRDDGNTVIGIWQGYDDSWLKPPEGMEANDTAN